MRRDRNRIVLDTTKQRQLAQIIPRGMEGDPVIEEYRLRYNKQRETISALNRTASNPSSYKGDPEIILDLILEGGRGGVAELRPEFLFKGNWLPESHQRVIVLIEQMDYWKMSTVPSLESAREIMRTYMQLGDRLISLAQKLVDLGVSVFVHHPLGDFDEYHQLLLPPHARHAGLGEQGRTGLFIDYELGPLVRVGGISTDIAIPNGKPKDRGITEFCKKCVYCVNNCPVSALPSMTKLQSLVEGVEIEFKVNGDRCIKYFSNHYGCGMCMFHCVLAKPTKEEITKRVERIETWYTTWEIPGLLNEEKMNYVKRVREQSTS